MDDSILKLSFMAEGTTHASPISARIIRSFQPFTIAQALLVEPIHPGNTPLPSQFVLKLIDPRFSAPAPKAYRPLNKKGWTRRCDQEFKYALSRVRSGAWPNHWKCLGSKASDQWADRDFPAEISGDSPDDAPLNDDEVRYLGWLTEMDKWSGHRHSHDVELAAYRQLQSLQGSGIPKLYGTCRFSAGSEEEDPFITDVPGLLLEYVDGVCMQKLVPGQNISAVDAERISQGILTTLRGIRDHLVVHNDFAARNVIARLDDPDHPVIIDFGCALLFANRDDTIPTMDRWIAFVAREREIFRAKDSLDRLRYHNPSPVPEQYADWATRPFYKGYRYMNNLIEKLSPEKRDQYYERIDKVPPSTTKTSPDGIEYTWEFPRWRIRPGVMTANASADYMWGRKEMEETERIWKAQELEWELEAKAAQGVPSAS